jgi:TRAP-type C4-dicarboxylate transport system permease small subunit
MEVDPEGTGNQVSRTRSRKRGCWPFLDLFLEIIICLLFVSMVAISAAQVFWRYVLNASLVWSEELARYLFIWIVFLASPLGIHQGTHIGVDLLMSHLPSKWRRAALIFTHLFILLFLVFLIVLGLRVVKMNMTQTSIAMEIPMGYIYLGIPTGALLMILYTLRSIRERLRADMEESPTAEMI